MSALDSKVSSILDSSKVGAGEEDEDALFDQLENDDSTFDALREQRMQQLHNELARAKQMRNEEHGTYSEILEEKKLMDITTSTKLCVVHFFKPDFHRCSIMDTHLDSLSKKHFDTRFLRINVENAPFLITKLKIQVLPCVITFVNGVSTDRIIGFEGLSYMPDSFTTKDLESRLLRAGVLVRAKTAAETKTSSFSHTNKASSSAKEDEDDSDWD